jgi:hypothetical protein
MLTFVLFACVFVVFCRSALFWWWVRDTIGIHMGKLHNCYGVGCGGCWCWTEIVLLVLQLWKVYLPYCSIPAVTGEVNSSPTGGSTHHVRDYYQQAAPSTTSVGIINKVQSHRKILGSVLYSLDICARWWIRCIGKDPSLKNFFFAYNEVCYSPRPTWRSSPLRIIGCVAGTAF